MSEINQLILPEGLGFCIVDFKVFVTALKCLNFFGAHGLVLIELAQTTNNIHHLVHASFLTSLH